MSGSDVTTKECIGCGNSILLSANVCMHCGQLQNWKRLVNFSSVVLSLVIAFITLFSLAIPYYKKQFEPPETILKATLLGIVNNEYHLLISNIGNRVGAIETVHILTGGIGNYRVRPLAYSRYDLINPSQAVKLVARSQEQTPLVITTIEGLSASQLQMINNCTLIISGVSYNGTRMNIKRSFKCIAPKNLTRWQELSMLNTAVNLFNALPFGGTLNTDLADELGSFETSSDYSDDSLSPLLLDSNVTLSNSHLRDALKSIVSEQLGVAIESLDINTHFKHDLAADSLDRVELIMAIETALDIEIPDEYCERFNSISDVMDYYNTHHN